MSDLAYNIVWAIGLPAFRTSASPIVLHRERTKHPGAFILAPTHLSHYDVPVLMAETPRYLDWVSIVEAFRNPFVALLYGSVNTFPLDRSKPDSPTVRIILDRLKRGRVIAMFPEGNIRTPETSVLAGGSLKPGIARIAQMAHVPVIPCVVLGSGIYSKFTSWLPLRRVRYGIAYGEPMTVRTDVDKAEAVRLFVEDLRAAYMRLHAELLAEMPGN